MGFGEHLSSDGESECFGGSAWMYPAPRSIDIMRGYYDWIPMSFFTKDKVSGA